MTISRLLLARLFRDGRGARRQRWATVAGVVLEAASDRGGRWRTEDGYVLEQEESQGAPWVLRGPGVGEGGSAVETFGTRTAGARRIKRLREQRDTGGAA